MARPGSTTITVAASGSLSDAAPVANGDDTLVGVVTPAALEAGTTTLTFQVSHNNGATYADLYDESAEYALAASVSAARYIKVDPVLFLGATHVKLRCGTTGSPVAQTANRVFTLVYRGLD